MSDDSQSDFDLDDALLAMRGAAGIERKPEPEKKKNYTPVDPDLVPPLYNRRRPSASPQSEYLCVGGLNDGRRLSAADAGGEFIRLPAQRPVVRNIQTFKSGPVPYPDTEVVIEDYRRGAIQGDGAPLFIYAHSSLSDGEVMRALVEGYRRDQRNQS